MSSSEVPVPQVLPVPGQPPSSTVQHLSLSSQGGRWLQPTGQGWALGRLGHTLGPQQSLRHEPNPDHLVLWTKSNPTPAGSAQGMETVRKHRLSAGLSQVGGSGGDEASAQARLLRGLLLPSGSPGRRPSLPKASSVHMGEPRRRQHGGPWPCVQDPGAPCSHRNGRGLAPAPKTCSHSRLRLPRSTAVSRCSGLSTSQRTNRPPTPAPSQLLLFELKMPGVGERSHINPNFVPPPV